MAREPQFRWGSAAKSLEQLTEWQRSIFRWRHPDQALELLESTRAAKEPIAIPRLMSLGISPNATVRDRARSVIADLLKQLTLEGLPVLDGMMRRHSYEFEDWYHLKPASVSDLMGSNEADRIYVGLLSCHRNGYVRAEALRILGSEYADTVIPFALIRLNDWVPDVRKVAELEVSRKLRVQYADKLVDCLPVLARVARSEHFQPRSKQSIEEFLRSPECASALLHGTDARSRQVRRYCYTLALRHQSVDQKALIAKASGDEDVAVRKWAFTEGPGVHPAGESELMRQAATDAFGPIRQVAFQRLANTAALDSDELRMFLFDHSATIRVACQDLLRARETAIAQFYRTAIGQGWRLAISVVGLAETGEQFDVQLVLPLLRHRSARVRRAAVRALRAFSAEKYAVLLRELVARDVPSVAREATLILLTEIKLPAPAVWEEASKNRDLKARGAVLRQLWRARKWQQLEVYLRALLSAERELQESAVSLIERWLFRFNQSFAQPTASDREALPQLFEAVRSQLPGKMAAELIFILRSI